MVVNSHGKISKKATWLAAQHLERIHQHLQVRVLKQSCKSTRTVNKRIQFVNIVICLYLLSIWGDFCPYLYRTERSDRRLVGEREEAGSGNAHGRVCTPAPVGSLESNVIWKLLLVPQRPYQLHVCFYILYCSLSIKNIIRFKMMCIKMLVQHTHYCTHSAKKHRFCCANSICSVVDLGQFI